MKYDSTEIPLQILKRKGAEVIGNEIVFQQDAPLGIKAWGKLDYLRNKGFRLARVENVGKYIKSLSEGVFLHGL